MALERLNDEDIEGEKLIEEIRRSGAITDVAEQIISNANTGLKAVSLRREFVDPQKDFPKMLGD